MRRGLRLSLLAFLPCLGCAATWRVGRPDPVPDEAMVVSERAAARCMHGQPGPESPYREALPGPVTDAALRAHLAPLDPTVLRTAQAAGLEPLLAEVLRARVSGVDPHDPALLSMRLELAQRIATLEVQLTATEFECDCVRNLLYVVLSDYEESETDRQLSWTVASLAVGAAASIVGASWDLANTTATTPVAEDAPLWISIGGAVAGAGLGAIVLARLPREVTYVHEHNLLRPLLRGDDPELLYPTFVFRMLTLPRAGGRSPRDELLEGFEERIADEVPPERRELARALLFGEGGVYDPSLLALHQELLQELGAALDALARDIDLLARAVAIALEMDFDPTPPLAP